MVRRQAEALNKLNRGFQVRGRPALRIKIQAKAFRYPPRSNPLKRMLNTASPFPVRNPPPDVSKHKKAAFTHIKPHPHLLSMYIISATG